MLKSLGAEIIMADDVNTNDTYGLRGIAKKLSEEIPNAYFVDQYNNPWSVEAYEYTLAPEILRQVPDVKAVYVGMGTGSIVTGSGRFFKRNNLNVQVIGVTPDSGILYAAYHNIKRENNETSTIIEGVGEDFVSNILDFSVIDNVIEVPDEESKEACHFLAKKGLFFGASTGMIYAATKKYNVRGKKVIIAGDTGLKYISNIYKRVNNNFRNRELRNLIKKILKYRFDKKGDFPKYIS